jgi:hypothetical protein
VEYHWKNIQVIHISENAAEIAGMVAFFSSSMAVLCKLPPTLPKVYITLYYKPYYATIKTGLRHRSHISFWEGNRLTLNQTQHGLTAVITQPSPVSRKTSSLRKLHFQTHTHVHMSDKLSKNTEQMGQITC